MLHHIVWWTLKEEAEGRTVEENAKRLAGLGNALRGKIDELLSIEFSVNIASTSTLPAHLVLHSTHKNADDLAAYATHPLHVAFGKELKPCVASREALDYEV